MHTNAGLSAEAFIAALTESIDNVWRDYGENTSLDSLIYANKEYGLMQCAELSEIMNLLVTLKNRLRSLSDDCLDIPAEISPGKEK